MVVSSSHIWGGGGGELVQDELALYPSAHVAQKRRPLEERLPRCAAAVPARSCRDHHQLHPTAIGYAWSAYSGPPPRPFFWVAGRDQRFVLGRISIREKKGDRCGGQL